MTITTAATRAAKDNSTWIQWFNTRASASIINQSQQERFFKTFDAGIAEDSILEKVISHEETTFLHRVNFEASPRVAIFHHLVTSGGTIYDNRTKEFGFLQGVGSSNAIPMTPDVNVLKGIASDTDTPVPAIASILAVKTSEEVDNLNVSATVKFRARNFIPIPPFLLESIHETIATANGDSKKVLIQVVQKIKDFDTAHADDDKFTDKAKSKCKEVLYWLYLVSAGSEAIAAVNTIGCNNDVIMNRMMDIGVRSLQQDKYVDSIDIATQVEASLKRPFEVLAATSTSTTDFMEKLTLLQSQNGEKATKTFKKIPAKYQQMILVAASSSDVTEIDYDADAVEFFKCSTPLHAQVMLNSLFESEGIECSVSPALATTLLYGSFLWRNSLSPAGLAASVLTSEGVLRNDTLQEGMVLDFATKFEMSTVSLSKLTKTQVVFPLDVEELTHRIRGLHSLSNFFFKKHSFLSQGIKQLVNFCLDHRSILKTKIYLDTEFIAKFLCAVDERVYMWLKQCSIHQTVTDTDLSLVNYSSLIQDVKLNRFNYALPPTIASIIAIPKEKSRSKDQRRERGTREMTELVRNGTRVEQWKLRHGESWNNIFRNKTIDGPLLSTQCHPCLKYHVRGSCYADCRNKTSHCVLNSDDKSKMDKFIKSLRGE